jgi:hypothetical protein
MVKTASKALITTDRSLIMLEESREDGEQDKQKLTFWQVLTSTFGAAVGVQSKATRTRDFSQGKPAQFIFAGILFVITFITVIVLVVRTVISATQ